ncbi:MAG: hypothetical protein OEY07_18785 [Gammaproteobacteria bacterium]|nr:hypothetical protein [Gammaproteobacteria bacterium]
MTNKKIIHFQNLSMPGVFWTVLVTFMAGISACSDNTDTQQARRPTATTAPVSRAINSQDAAVEKTMAIIEKHQLTKLAPNCFVVSIGNELVNGRFVIDVREHHSKECGGDQNVSLRLFSLEIEQKTGKVWTDANSLDGEYRLIE